MGECLATLKKTSDDIKGEVGTKTEGSQPNPPSEDKMRAGLHTSSTPGYHFNPATSQPSRQDKPFRMIPHVNPAAQNQQILDRLLAMEGRLNDRLDNLSNRMDLSSRE